MYTIFFFFLYNIYMGDLLIRKNNKERVILHVDCNSFFASVEIALNPNLKNVPLAVTGDPNLRHGIILAKNDIAKKYKVQTAEPIWKAKRKCPDLVCVLPHYDKYLEYSIKCNQIYNQYTDLVEQFGIDESWLDVTDSIKLFGSGYEIAKKISNQIKKELNITVSIGISFNKVFAKFGSDYKKPDAITEITKDNYKNIVFPMSVENLLMVGPKTSQALKLMNIITISDLANTKKEILIKYLGKLGGVLYDYANGLDDSPVLPSNYVNEEKSISHGQTYPYDITDYDDLSSKVAYLCDYVGLKLRKKNIKACVIQVVIVYFDLVRINRQTKLDNPTNLTIDITAIVMNLINTNIEKNKPIRGITVGASDFVKTSYNDISIFSSEEENLKKEKIQKTIDASNEKYGKNLVFLGSQFTKKKE